MNALLVRTVESFAEPDFSRLQRLVFADLQQPSPELVSVEAAESEVRSKRSTTHPPICRLGAFDGENLVGWYYGRHERGNVFYMADSGVVPPHRRRGVFSSLLNAIREHALSTGAIAVRSEHSVLDPAVVIAKLRTGFLITGLNQSAHMGTFVEMTLHCLAGRLALFRNRALPHVAPDEATPPCPSSVNHPNRRTRSLLGRAVKEYSARRDQRAPGIDTLAAVPILASDGP